MMKRCLSILLTLALLLVLAACGGKSGADVGADANKLVIWHDKEDAVIQALQEYLAEAVPDLDITFEKKTSLTDSLKLVGNESQTVGPENAPAEAHRLLLGADIVLLEGIVLKDVKEGKYLLCAAPLNLAGCDGAPCRAFLLG